MASKRRRGKKEACLKSKEKGKSLTRGRSSNPFGIIFKNESQKTRYDTLVKKKVVNTRYLNNNVLKVLGFKDDVFWMLEQVGWIAFVNMKFPTYIRLTLEFLSLIEASVLYREGCDEGYISFHLFNTEHQLNLEQFNTIFDLPCGGKQRDPTEFRVHDVWADFTQEVHYDSSRAKATGLRNLYFHYLHRTISHTIFGRGDNNGVVPRSESLFLWAIHNNIHLNTSSHLVRHLIKVDKASARNIVIGGLITPTTLALGYDLTSLQEATGSTRIDLETCIAIKMIVREGDCYYLILIDQTPHPLLDPARTTVCIRANWDFPSAPQPEPLRWSTPLANPHKQDHLGIFLLLLVLLMQVIWRMLSLGSTPPLTSSKSNKPSNVAW